MGLIDGDAFVSGDIFSFQQAERMRTNWIQSDPQTNISNPQDGMAVVDSDDDKFYLYSGSAYEEILQLTRSFDVSPQFASVRFMDTPGADHYLDFICNEELTGNKTFHLIVNDINAELNINTKEALGIGEALRENLLTNSGFGVWSQSDTNKGIGYLDFDSGSVVPVVGETLTGATSGATGKVIWVDVTGGTWGGGNAVGTVYLGACSTACFNDDETITGSVGGANIMTVNQPDGAVGTDGKVKNGAFVHDIDPPNGWTSAGPATLTTEAGGAVGNCLMITENGAGGANPSAGQSVTLETGKIYKLAWQTKQGTESTYRIQIHNGFGWITVIQAEAGAAWAAGSFTFEALGVAGAFDFAQICAGGAGTTIYFDEITLYEITPGCTAADSLAFDGWVKDTTCDIYRQHNDGGTLTKDGSFYSLKIVPTTAGDYVIWQPIALWSKAEFTQQFAGRTVCEGFWAKTSTANHFRLGIYDGVGFTYSSYHTGGGNWEWIEIPKTMADNASDVEFQFIMSQAGNVNGSTIVYVSQPILVFGSSIGEGNYRPRQQEWIYLETIINSQALHNISGWSDVNNITLNVEADSDAKLPKGCVALRSQITIRDSGSAAGTPYMWFLYTDIATVTGQIGCGGLANDGMGMYNFQINCRPNGDYRYSIDATGANTFDILEFRYNAVQVN